MIEAVQAVSDFGDELPIDEEFEQVGGIGQLQHLDALVSVRLQKRLSQLVGRVLYIPMTIMSANFE